MNSCAICMTLVECIQDIMESCLDALKAIDNASHLFFHTAYTIFHASDSSVAGITRRD